MASTWPDSSYKASKCDHLELLSSAQVMWRLEVSEAQQSWTLADERSTVQPVPPDIRNLTVLTRFHPFRSRFSPFSLQDLLPPAYRLLRKPRGGLVVSLAQGQRALGVGGSGLAVASQPENRPGRQY